MSDQTALSFAGKDARAEGVAVVFAEEGPKFTPAAKDFDKKSAGLLSRAAGITGFKGKRESSVDLIAPQGLGFARVVVAGLGKPESYVMTSLHAETPMTYAGTTEPACFANLNSIGTINPADTHRLSALLCSALSKGLGIPTNRV